MRAWISPTRTLKAGSLSCRATSPQIDCHTASFGASLVTADRKSSHRAVTVSVRSCATIACEAHVATRRCRSAPSTAPGSSMVWKARIKDVMWLLSIKEASVAEVSFSRWWESVAADGRSDMCWCPCFKST